MNAVEGDSAILRCSASSKPLASFTLKKGSDIIIQGPGTASYNGLIYRIDTVHRNQTGAYTCIADNSISPYDSKVTNFTVLYPPDITVSLVNTTAGRPLLTVTCNASGVPNQYTYERWVHTWNGQVVSHPEPLPNTRVLTLTYLSYAHSGVYTCGAANGIKRISRGSGNLLVKSIPVVVGDVAETMVIKASGHLMRPIAIVFQYYSNSGKGSVHVYRNNGTCGREEVVHVVHLRYVDIILPVFRSKITTPGVEATVKTTLTDESQFGLYEIELKNDVGLVKLSLVIQPSASEETSIQASPSDSVGAIIGSFFGGVLMTTFLNFTVLRLSGRKIVRQTDDTKSIGEAEDRQIELKVPSDGRNPEEPMNPYETLTDPGQSSHMYAELKQTKEESNLRTLAENVYLNLSLK